MSESSSEMWDGHRNTYLEKSDFFPEKPQAGKKGKYLLGGPSCLWAGKGGLRCKKKTRFVQPAKETSY